MPVARNLSSWTTDAKTVYADFLKHLRKHGCFLKREGRSHSLWCSPKNGAIESIPRHVEIPNRLAVKICRGLHIPVIGR